MDVKTTSGTTVYDLPEFLKVQEVAKILRVDRKTVYDLIERGELQAIRIGRRGLIRVSRDVLASYLEGRATPTGEHPCR